MTTKFPCLSRFHALPSSLAAALVALSLTPEPWRGVAWASEPSPEVQAEGQSSAQFTAPSQEPPKMEPVVMARVGTAVITVEDFMRFLSQHPDRVDEATTQAGKAQLLREAIEQRLLIAAMVKEGLIEAGAKPAEMQSAFRQLVEMKFPLPPEPTEEAMRQYYEAHKEDFGIPASVRVRQIQFRVPKNATPEDHAAAKARAEAALRRLEAGESFEDLAVELTEHRRAKATKGDMGYVTRYGLPWFEQALAGLKVGEHTGIVAHDVGYDILLLMDERNAILTPFEEAKPEVSQRMRAEAQEAARAAYVKSLADTVEITIEIEELKNAYPGGIFP